MAKIRAALLVTALVFTPAILTPTAPSLAMTWTLLGIQMLLGPTAMVGKVTSVHFAWVGIVGTAVGPTLVASISDRMFTGAAAIGQALTLVSGAMSVIAFVGFGFLSAYAWRGRGQPLETSNDLLIAEQSVAGGADA